MATLLDSVAPAVLANKIRERTDELKRLVEGRTDTLQRIVTATLDSAEPMMRDERLKTLEAVAGADLASLDPNEREQLQKLLREWIAWAQDHLTTLDEMKQVVQSAD